MQLHRNFMLQLSYINSVKLHSYLSKMNPGWSDDAWEYAWNGHATAVGSSSIHATDRGRFLFLPFWWQPVWTPGAQWCGHVLFPPPTYANGHAAIHDVRRSQLDGAAGHPGAPGCAHGTHSWAPPSPSPPHVTSSSIPTAPCLYWSPLRKEDQINIMTEFWFHADRTQHRQGMGIPVASLLDTKPFQSSHWYIRQDWLERPADILNNRIFSAFPRKLHFCFI